MATSSGLDKLLGRDMPEIAYLKSTNISQILSKGLAETYRVKPTDPKTYFAKFLLNYAHEQKIEGLREEKQQTAARLRAERTKNIEEEKEIAAAAVKEDNSPAAVMARAKEYFMTNIRKSVDLEDNLQELVEFVQEQTNATGVYVGKLVCPSKEIDEEADDKAHLDEEAPKVIKFMHASKGHEFMVDCVLDQEEAPISHEVFKEGEEEAEEAGEGEEGSEAGDEKPAKEKDIIESFKHSYVPEVVREARMHFKKVPRLGCFMAVPLVYNSCLFNEALEEAVEDYQVVSKEREEQDKLKTEKEEQLAQAKDGEGAAEEDDTEWKEIDFAPFKTFKEQYVLCLDTLGQDRQFSDEEKRFTLQTILAYKEAWEAQEVASLTADRDRKLEAMGIERDETADNEQAQEMTDATDALELDLDYFDTQMIQDDAILKDIHDNQRMLQVEAQWFTEKEEWQKILANIKAFRVLKMPHIIQGIFFLNKIERERICEPKSNKLSWKKSKELLEKELPELMAQYKTWGEKKDDYKPYMRINYIEKLIAEMNQEEVDTYHAGVGKLFKWLKMAVDTRKQDVIRRKAIQKKNREDKSSKEEAKAKREADREQFLLDKEAEFNEQNKEDIEAYEKWQEEQQKKAAEEYGEEAGSEEEDNQANAEPPTLPVFDKQEMEEKFDDENPPIEIPPEQDDDINNDWVLEEDQEAELINAFLTSKEST